MAQFLNREERVRFGPRVTHYVWNGEHLNSGGTYDDAAHALTVTQAGVNDYYAYGPNGTESHRDLLQIIRHKENELRGEVVPEPRVMRSQYAPQWANTSVDGGPSIILWRYNPVIHRYAQAGRFQNTSYLQDFEWLRDDVLMYEPHSSHDQFRMDEWLRTKTAEVRTRRNSERDSYREQVDRSRGINGRGTRPNPWTDDAWPTFGIDDTPPTVQQGRMIGVGEQPQSQPRGRSMVDTMREAMDAYRMNNVDFDRQIMGQFINAVINEPTNQETNNKEKDMAAEKVAAPPNETLAKAKVTAGLLGIHLTPQDIVVLSEYKTTSECNKYIMEKKAGQTQAQLTEEQKQKIREATSMKNSAAYRDKKRAYDQIQSNLNHYTNTLDNEYRKLYQVQRELKKLEADTSGQDLVPSIEKTLADGWYSLYEVTPEYIVLITGVVHCNHPDIKMTVDLGQFKIKFNFQTGAVTVMSHQGNINYGGYMHPHIDSGGGVCWGNANNTYKRAREALDIELLFRTLRALLSAYDPGSPYVTLIELDHERNKDKYKNMKQVYVSAKVLGRGSYTIETSENISDDYIEEIEQGDDDYTYIYEAYFKVYENTPIRCDEYVYVKDGSGFTEAEDYDWR